MEHSGVGTDEQRDRTQVPHTVIEPHNPGAADQVLAADSTVYMVGLPEPVRGRDAWKELIGSYFRAFPDLELEIEDEVAEDDRVAMRLAWSGTHRGDFLGIPATGRRVRVQSSVTFRVVDGRVETEWHQDDVLGLLQQIGAAPSAAPVAAVSRGERRGAPPDRYFAILAIATAAFGVGFMLAPAPIWQRMVFSWFSRIFVARMFGTANIGAGVLMWWPRSALDSREDARLTQGLLGMLAIWSLARGLVTSTALAGGLTNSAGWVFVTYDAGLLVVYAVVFMRMRKRIQVAGV